MWNAFGILDSFSLCILNNFKLLSESLFIKNCIYSRIIEYAWEMWEGSMKQSWSTDNDKQAFSVLRNETDFSRKGSIAASLI